MSAYSSLTCLDQVYRPRSSGLCKHLRTQNTMDRAFCGPEVDLCCSDESLMLLLL